MFSWRKYWWQGLDTTFLLLSSNYINEHVLHQPKQQEQHLRRILLLDIEEHLQAMLLPKH